MNKISQRTKGIVCILFAAFGFSMMTVFVRLAGDVPTAEKAFFRNFVALLLVSVLKGAVVFMTDLMRHITVPCSIDFMVVSSYGNGVKTSGVVKIVKDLDADLAGKDLYSYLACKYLLIVEDILDTGMTLHYLKQLLQDRNPNSIRIATLLDKPERRRAAVRADYVGYQVPDEFVVGYGLDYDEKYRNLPYVGILKPDVYEK